MEKLKDIFSQRCCFLKCHLKKEYEGHLVVTDHGDLKNNLNSSYHEEIQEYQDRILYYLAYQTRKTYLNAQFNAALLDLNKDGGILVALHTVLLYTKPKYSVEINIQAIDHWSTDAHQDTWFSASSLHSVMENLDVKPKWISIISDNGPHYHNSELMIIMSKWYE
ncbi:hypothetical protein C1645_842361 [Glomus cerebriforme]|uniref:Uncharacterized protein n=1 Tax=Glomus cerebriforme TaxID=658196 RepID=A0A397S336_9GLOM|nr:hypothetical protein C1645_842361 [Glomus cerebriforme]